MPKSNTLTEFYLIRHAETVMNVSANLVGGRSNETPLTPLGIEQAKTLGRRMQIKGIIPDKVFVSPAIRTIDTAHYSLAEMGLDTELLIQDALQELGQGEFEGRLRSEVYTDAVLRDITRLGKDFKLESGESMNDVGVRMHGWITETLPDPIVDKPMRYFVYTHGGSIRCLASHILDWNHRETYETEINNTSVSLLTVEDGVFRVAYLNRDAAEI